MKNVDETELVDAILKQSPANPIIVTDINKVIVGVNQPWVNMCNFSSEEAFGLTPKLLQGPLTNMDATRSFSSKLGAGGGNCFASVLNYKKANADGERVVFVNHLYGWCVGDLMVAETYI